MAVVEPSELPQGVEQMALVRIKVRSSSSRRQVCTHLSVIELIRGIRTPLSTTSILASARTVSNRWGNFRPDPG
jgi:hypothetical protein